ncbi:MAG: Wzz/FepE/Etk N-terminal domain-containing protein, partial [Ramlibacter sp.]
MSNRQPLNADIPDLPPPHGTALALQQPYRLQTALERHHEEQAGDESLTLTDLLRIVLKHKWTLLIVILLACAVAAVRTFLSTPVYRSTAVLQIERVAPSIVKFNNEVDQDQGYVDEAMSQKTQYELLKSRSLAERVIDELRLDQSKPILAPDGTEAAAASDAAAHASDGAKGDYLERIVSGYRKLTSPTTRDTAALGRDAVIRSFIKSLTVEPVRSSRLVKLHVNNTNPELAARIANATVQAYITMGLERRTEGLSYAKNFLVDQIKQMKARLEE